MGGQEIVMVQSVMGLVLVLFGAMVGLIWGTRDQIRQVARDEAQNRPHEDVTADELRDLMGLYKRIMWFLVGILALLVVLDRFVPGTGL